ncbi:MAG TPA: hypothetical protein VLJ59_19540 [Mycobacteriales bacterium]|nr:hypothetical protein [Mycobacteriales bacterium]
MEFLGRERAVLDELLPGLDKTLADADLMELEKPGGPGIAAFTAARGPALMVPTEHAGLGADPLRAVRVQRAVGARMPSVAVATTMHHYSIATLVETSRLSSGFAEGRARRSWCPP